MTMLTFFAQYLQEMIALRVIFAFICGFMLMRGFFFLNPCDYISHMILLTKYAWENKLHTELYLHFINVEKRLPRI